MDIRVAYLGNDAPYFNKLQKKFKQDYPAIHFEFIHFSIHECSAPIKCFIRIYELFPHIIYLDYSLEPTNLIRLAKLIGRNNEMRIISIVGLYNQRNKSEVLLKSLNASVRINYLKSDEIQDVVYDPVSLLDVDLAIMPEYVSSKSIEKFEIWQPMRLGYIEDNHFHVETNSYLKEGEVVTISDHPLMDIMPSRKVHVEKFYETDLYYNKRFAYDLEFIFIDNDYFAATNDHWKLYKKWKMKPELMESVPEEEKDFVLRDMDKRREIFGPTRRKIIDWVKARENQKVPKKLKIMVLDETLSLLEQIHDEQEFRFWINFQTILKNDFYHIKRTTPHLIIFHMGEKNNRTVYWELLRKIKEIKNYDPYILVFNVDQEEIDRFKTGHPNKHTLYHKGEVDLKTITSLAEKLDEKLHISSAGERVYYGHSHPESIMFLKREVRLISMTESIMYFESELEIPMWTVFSAKRPVEMLLTVVPHKSDSAYAKMKNIYRCLINGVGEVEKSKIRQMINKTLEEDYKDD